MPTIDELDMARAKAIGRAIFRADWGELYERTQASILDAVHAIRTADDAAMAVTDEEVVTESVISAVAREIWMNGGPDLATHHAAAGARGMLAAIHAAGLKVIRA